MHTKKNLKVYDSRHLLEFYFEFLTHLIFRYDHKIIARFSAS